MSKTKNPGSTGNDGGDAEISNAVSFPVIEGTGEAAFAQFLDFAEEISHTAAPLSAAATWRRAGLRGHAHAVQIASGYLMDAAAARFTTAASKIGFISTYETWKDHPAFDFEAAAAWLTRSNRKLFADRTYARLGGSMTAFYDGLQNAYADLARQNVRVAKAMLDTDPDDPRALELITFIGKRCFDRLGIQTLTDDAAKLIGVTEGQLDWIENRATRARLRTQLREAGQLRWRGRNSKNYCESVLQAWETLRDHDETVLEDQAAFRDLNFNPKMLEAEAQHAVEILIHEPLARLAAGVAVLDLNELKNRIENFEHWRSLFDAVEVEGANPNHADDDFWCAEILDEYGFRSFTHLMQSMHRMYGANLAMFALRDRKRMPPEELHDALLEAREHLEKGNIVFDRDEMFDGMGFTGDALLKALKQTAPAVVQRDYSLAHFPGAPTKTRLEYAQAAGDALDLVMGTRYEARIGHGADAVYKTLSDLKLRLAEERLVMSMAAMRGDGLYLVMKDWINALEDEQTSLASKTFQTRTGMSAQTASALQADYDRADMVALWSAARDKNEDPLQALRYAAEFEDRLEKLDPGTVPDFILAMGEDFEDHQKRVADIATAAMNTAVERMSFAPTDTLSNEQFFQVIRNAVKLVYPDALEYDEPFKKLTGKTLGDFLKQERETHDRATQLVESADSLFTITRKQAIARLKRIKAMTPSAKGWLALRELRQRAVSSGFTLGDDDILNGARLNYYQLADLNCDHALAGARDHLDMAIAKKNGAISLATMDHHAYFDYRRTCEWIARSGYKVLDDEVYRQLGLASRADFTERMRESLFDYMLEIETAIVRDGITSIGPVRYLNAMQELRDAYQVLGFDNERDDASDMPQDLVSNAVNVRTVRQALSAMGPNACLSILNGDAHPAAKTHDLLRVLDFVNRMGVALDEAKVDRIHQKFASVLYQRFEGIIGHFNKNPDDMARGWRIATAIGGAREKYQMEGDEWLNTLFEDTPQGNFKTFCEDMAIRRLDQLHQRIERRVHAANEQDRGGGALNRKNLLDIGRIYAVIESPLLDAERVPQIMSYAKIDREWVQGIHRESTSLALQFLSDIAFDPSMTAPERADMIDELFALRDIAGDANTIVQSMDWDQLGEMRTQMALMQAGEDVLQDLLRVEVAPSWSPVLLNMYNTLEDAGLSMDNAGHLQELGLSEGEAAQYAQLAKLAHPYSNLLLLAKADSTDFNTVYNTLIGIFRHAQENGIDLDSEDTRRALGVRSDSEMQHLVIRPALNLASTMSSTLKSTQDPKHGHMVGKAMQSFLKASRLEKRIDASTLKEEGIIARTKLRKMIGRFGAMLQGKPGPV